MATACRMMWTSALTRLLVPSSMLMDAASMSFVHARSRAGDAGGQASASMSLLLGNPARDLTAAATLIGFRPGRHLDGVHFVTVRTPTVNHWLAYLTTRSGLV